jgi:hypothetical protein
MKRIGDLEINLRFTEAPLTDVLAFLTDFAEVGFLLDPARAELGGRPITLQTQSLKVANTLGLALRMVGPELVYLPKGNVVVVTTEDRVRRLEEALLPAPGPDGSPEDRDLYESLAAHRVDLDFTEAQVADILDFLRDHANANLVVEDASLLPERPLTLRLLDVSAVEFLELMAGLFEWRLSIRERVVVIEGVE